MINQNKINLKYEENFEEYDYRVNNKNINKKNKNNTIKQNYKKKN
jgi:hypothetical protein